MELQSQKEKIEISYELAKIELREKREIILNLEKKNQLLQQSVIHYEQVIQDYQNNASKLEQSKNQSLNQSFINQTKTRPLIKPLHLKNLNQKSEQSFDVFHIDTDKLEQSIMPICQQIILKKEQCIQTEDQQEDNDSELLNLKQRIYELEQELTLEQISTKNLKETIRTLKETQRQTSKQINQSKLNNKCDEDVNQKIEDIKNSYDVLIEKKDKEILQLESNYNILQEQIDDLQKNNELLYQQLSNKDEQINEIDNEKNQLEWQIEELRKLEGAKEQRDQEVQISEEDQSLKIKLISLQTILEEKDQQIYELEQNNHNFNYLQEQIQGLNQELEFKEICIINQQKQIIELREELSSKELEEREQEFQSTERSDQSKNQIEFKKKMSLQQQLENSIRKSRIALDRSMNNKGDQKGKRPGKISYWQYEELLGYACDKLKEWDEKLESDNNISAIQYQMQDLSIYIKNQQLKLREEQNNDQGEDVQHKQEIQWLNEEIYKLNMRLHSKEQEMEDMQEQMKKEVEEEEKMKEEIFEQMKELVEDEIKQDCMVELEKKDKEMENRIMRMKIKLEDIVFKYLRQHNKKSISQMEQCLTKTISSQQLIEYLGQILNNEEEIRQVIFEIQLNLFD